MTSVINDDLFPPSPPTPQETAYELLHSNLIEQEDILQTLPLARDSPELVPERDTPDSNPYEEEFIPGKFEYIEDKSTREMLVTAWQAISITETWGFINKPINSFMLSDDRRINIIYNKIEELGYTGHSGSSFGCTMRTIQYIVKNGEIKFKKEYLLSSSSE